MCWLPDMPRELKNIHGLFAFADAHVVMNVVTDATQEEAPEEAEEDVPPLSADVTEYMKEFLPIPRKP